MLLDSLHPAGDRAAEAWVAGQARTILAGGSEQAAASISAAADAVGLRPGSRKGIDDAVGYLKNKAAHLRYDTALTEGFPIATGIIEGACRHLLAAAHRLGHRGGSDVLAGSPARRHRRPPGRHHETRSPCRRTSCSPFLFGSSWPGGVSDVPDSNG
ncbi:hypothetical protein ACWC0A_32950 [Streptomyces scopuliridis]